MARAGERIHQYVIDAGPSRRGSGRSTRMVARASRITTCRTGDGAFDEMDVSPSGRGEAADQSAMSLYPTPGSVRR
jgi:hypothetical protein